jgi:hypothetical protein
VRDKGGGGAAAAEEEEEDEEEEEEEEEGDEWNDVAGSRWNCNIPLKCPVIFSNKNEMESSTQGTTNFYHFLAK